MFGLYKIADTTPKGAAGVEEAAVQGGSEGERIGREGPKILLIEPNPKVQPEFHTTLLGIDLRLARKVCPIWS
jgi:hypothetical protein